MPKQQKHLQNFYKRGAIVARVSVALALGVLLSAASFGAPNPSAEAATAATCSSIADCTNQINNGNQQVKNLKNEATSYKDAITRLSSAISSKQGEIGYSKSEQARLEREITNAQAQIDQQKSVLSEILRAMYIDGQISGVEMFATSKSFSEYVDKEEYRNAVQSSLKQSLDKIAELQRQLQSQKQQVSSLLSQQQVQAASLAQDQREQSSMLNYNQSQQVSYNAQTAANQSRLQALIAAQRSANDSSAGGYYFIRFPGTVRSFNPANYPYANAGFSMSTAPGCNDNDGPDKWGYCTRQCVSYAAWAVEASGRSAPRYWSDTKKWVAKARSAGVLLSNTPQRGDVAISTNGTWGHAMYVEEVNGNKFRASEYDQQLTGRLTTTRWVKW